jgi:hypothetical protein
MSFSHRFSALVGESPEEWPQGFSLVLRPVMVRLMKAANAQMLEFFAMPEILWGQ